MRRGEIDGTRGSRAEHLADAHGVGGSGRGGLCWRRWRRVDGSDGRRRPATGGCHRPGFDPCAERRHPGGHHHRGVRERADRRPRDPRRRQQARAGRLLRWQRDARRRRGPRAQQLRQPGAGVDRVPGADRRVGAQRRHHHGSSRCRRDRRQVPQRPRGVDGHDLDRRGPGDARHGLLHRAGSHGRVRRRTAPEGLRQVALGAAPGPRHALLHGALARARLQARGRRVRAAHDNLSFAASSP